MAAGVQLSLIFIAERQILCLEVIEAGIHDVLSKCWTIFSPRMQKTNQSLWWYFLELMMVLSLCQAVEVNMFPFQSSKTICVAFQHIFRAKHGEKGAKYLDRTNERACQYAAACRRAAHRMGAGIIDLWTSIQRQPDWQTSCLTDGMHLSAQGSGVMLEELLKVLKDSPWQPSLHYDAMPEDLLGPHIYNFLHPCEEDVEEARVSS
ncbi:GDSL esterase/lipase CPRD49 isoform X3 [Physcomitrium patens]|uniref:GDSL esterase/lipase CPRD49 isoform X3 n=1 Tax=Physcomitrium patens TaxID=3218 RepID=UPI000D163E7E|nr:GDSL esterase/lipase CPRD49-like isoform X3 [Physcomitrium patens]|eukprot:XP_024383652.1 GDSL esterase/lipase CPRD49-like isoform X3 [Physcomitrella patens]